MENFKKSKIAASVAALGVVGLSGGALAATNVITAPGASGVHPNDGTKMIAPSITGSTKIKLSVTSTAGFTGGGTLTVVGFNGTTVSATQAAINGDSTTSSTTSSFLGTLATSDTTATRAVLVFTANAADTIDGTNTCAVITQAGAFAHSNTGTNCTAATIAALANNGTNTNYIGVQTGYTGPIVTSATQSTANTGAVTLTFGTKLGSGTDGAGTLGGTTTFGGVVAATLNETTLTVMAGTGSTTASNGVTTLTVGAASYGSGSFTNSVNRISITATNAGLSDTAGNSAPTQTVLSSFTGGKPTFASGSAVALATGFATSGSSTAALWTAPTTTVGATSGTLTVSVRTKELLKDLTLAASDFAADTSKAVTLTPSYLLNSGYTGGLTSTGDTSSISTQFALNLATLKSAATANGKDVEFGFDSAGKLVVTADNWATTTPVTLGLNYSTSNTWAVKTSGTAMAAAGDNQAAVNIYASNALITTAAAYGTLDSNTDGKIDGIQIMAQEGVRFATLPATAAAAGMTAKGANGTKPTFTISNPTLNTSSNAASFVLANGLTGAEDWDGDGTADGSGDKSIWGDYSKVGTGVTGAGSATGLPFDFTLAGQAGTTTSATLTYDNVYRVTDGGKRPVQYNDGSSAVAPVDRAAPVLVNAAYTETTAAGTSVGGMARDASGEVLFTFSEGGLSGTASLGETLFNSVPADLANLYANINVRAAWSTTTADATASDGTDNGKFTNLPGTVQGQTVSIAYPRAFGTNITGASNAWEYSVVKPGLTVAAKPAGSPYMTGATAARVTGTGADANRVNKVVITYNENIARPTGQDTTKDLDGVFVVRAQVGARVADVQKRDGGVATSGTSDHGFYDFYLPSSAVKVGTEDVTLGAANKVVLTMPANSIPDDVEAIWIDYQGSSQNSSKANLRRATDLGTVADTGSNDTFANVAMSADPSSTSTSITTDKDTQKVSNITAFSFGGSSVTSKKLLTQAISGTVKDTNGATMVPDAGVVAHLISVSTGIPVSAAARVEPVVNDGGFVNVNRGPNSEASTTTTQTIALLQKAITAKDLQDVYSVVEAYNEVVNTAIDTGLDQAGGTFLKDAAKAALAAVVAKGAVITWCTGAQATCTVNNSGSTSIPDDAYGKSMRFGGTNPSTSDNSFITVSSVPVPAYVEITTGNGSGASVGNNGAGGSPTAGMYTAGTGAYSGNANAEFGRTATLSKTVNAKQQNGMTVYPVSIDLVTGSITTTSVGGTSNPVTGGMLSMKQGSIATKGLTAKKRYKLLDTGYGLVKSGRYQVVVGTTEEAFGSALKATDTDAFVLVGVKDAAGGAWWTVSQADSSFNNYVKFEPDLLKVAATTGKIGASVLNVDLSKIKRVNVVNMDNWQLLGVPGVMDRKSTAAATALMPRFFMAIGPNSGTPGTNFEFDNKPGDEAFTLGSSTTANAIQIMAEVKDTITGGIKPSAGMGLAWNHNSKLRSTTGRGGASFQSTAGKVLDVDGSGSTVDGVSYTLPFFYPVSSSTTQSKMVKGSWHLVTVPSATTFGALPAGVDAAIWIDTLNGATKTWFRGETTELDSFALGANRALFVHTDNTNAVTNF